VAIRRTIPSVCALCFCAVLESALPSVGRAQAPPTQSPDDSAATAEHAGAPAAAWATDSAHSGGPRLAQVEAGIQNGTDVAVPADTGEAREARPRAVEYSEGYGTRLTIHRIASYTELPLFATEFILGQRILNDQRNGTRASGGLRSAHTIVAGGLGVLFGVNTITGVWNLVEARHDPAGRTRRTIHGIGMLLADAGFVWTASLAGGAHRSDAAATNHRNAAIISMSVATASTLMMWLWKN
jgi:hypothetical protein